MKTQREVALELIGLYTAEYASLKDGIFAERAQRARLLVEAEHVKATTTPGVYEVLSSRGDQTYTVNGVCNCLDAQHEAPFGCCKHRIAAKLYSRTREAMLALQDTKHRHDYQCGQAHGWVECWAWPCDDGVSAPVLCPACVDQARAAAVLAGEAMDESPVAQTEQASTPRMPRVCGYCHEHHWGPKEEQCPKAVQDRQEQEAMMQAQQEEDEHGEAICAACGLAYADEDRADTEQCPACRVTQKEPPAFTFEQYEENPQHRLHVAGCAAIMGGPCSCITAPAPVVGRVLEPLGEAPCSVNVRFDFKGRQIQLTLRGTDEAEVMARLGRILDQYPVSE
jgi:hypothetical protein